MNKTFFPPVCRRRKSVKRRTYLYDMFAPDNCRRLTKSKCMSIYLDTCKWAAKRCQKRTRRV